MVVDFLETRTLNSLNKFIFTPYHVVFLQFVVIDSGDTINRLFTIAVFGKLVGTSTKHYYTTYKITAPAKKKFEGNENLWTLLEINHKKLCF